MTSAKPSTIASAADPATVLDAAGAQRRKFTPVAPQPQGDASSPPRKKFEFRAFESIVYDPSAEYWLVDDLLPAKGLSVIYGPPKARKSAVALDVMLAIARGNEWAGKWVAAGAAFYLGIEDKTGAEMVIEAYRQHHALKGHWVPFYFSAVAPNLGMGEGDMPALVADIEALIKATGDTPRVICVDTLVRTLAGASENAEGMAQFIDNCEAIASHFGCAVIAVHHTPHDQERMRGYSALQGAVMASWLVKKTDSAEGYASRVTLVDLKAGESGLSWPVNFSIHELPPNRRGKAERVQLVSEVGEPASGVAAGDKKGRKVPDSYKLFLSCFDVAVGDHGETVVPRDPSYGGQSVRAVDKEKIWPEFSRRYIETGGKPDAQEASKRKTFDRSVAALLKKRTLCHDQVKGRTEAMLWRGQD